MNQNQDITRVPLRTLFGLSLLIALLLQLVVVSYNHITGYLVISSAVEFLVRISYGTVLSTAVAFVLIYIDIMVIRLMNRKLPWDRHIYTRAGVQLTLTLVVASFFATLITLLSNLIITYTDDLGRVLFYNILITSVVNIIVVIILEAWFFFRKSTLEEKNRQELEHELSQIRFEVLKKQINPHFLFNSLNVLSSLINRDTAKAQQFIDEFAMIYRYVLETIEKSVVTLSEELEFVRSYMYLQKIRYGEGLTMETSLDSKLTGMLLPPLSLQVVLENAIKHNAISDFAPLKITIFHEGQLLVVRNNLRRKSYSAGSTGVGQVNLAKRYALICDQLPEFRIEDDHYLVKLPLIENE